ncbi:MAG TPA: AMP-binding protein [Alphaproteobacteria bacterium]|nr:AMP-binding protein [Alphaproteobacteria bacterium]
MPRSTLTDFLDELASGSGGAPALRYGDAVISYADLAERGRRVAQGLADLGVGAGDRVALWLPNAPAWLVLFFACARLKAIIVAVNTRFRAHEVGDIVGRSGAKVLVMWPGFKGIDFPAILAEVDAAALSSLRVVIVYGEDREDGAGHSERVAGRPALAYGALEGAEPYVGDEAAADAGCIVFTTSGTTSRPKFVLHPQRSHVDHARAVAGALAMAAGDAASLLSLPLAGTFGMASALAALASGRPAALMPTFEAGVAAHLVRAYDITHMNGSDEMYLRMLEAFPDRHPFPSLRCCGFAAFGGDPGEVVRRCDARGLTLIGAYGMSEVQALFALRDPAAPAAERMRGGGNPVSPGAFVRVRDPETGALLGPGEQGELEIKGPSMMLEYLGNVEATADTLTADGYIRTGDLGAMDDARGFTYLSRMGDTLRLGGYLVAPEEISNFLESHPSVAGAQVVGVDGQAGGAVRGTQAVAFVIPAKDTAFSEEDLRGHCAAGLAKFKVPARIFAVEAFPVTESANGVKVQRGKLRDLAISMIGERQGAAPVAE